MEQTHSQLYIGAPNGVVLCVDRRRGLSLQGRLYHSYSKSETPFSDLGQATLLMERIYNRLQFPFPGTNQRRFAGIDPAASQRPSMLWPERKRIMSDEQLLQKHGDIGTFIVRVQHRQNSSWQGRVTWMEADKTVQFRSVWEMIKLIESAIDTVSVSEDSEQLHWDEEESVRK